MTYRRQFLRGITAGSIVALAGCSSDDGQEATSSGDESVDGGDAGADDDGQTGGTDDTDDGAQSVEGTVRNEIDELLVPSHHLEIGSIEREDYEVAKVVFTLQNDGDKEVSLSNFNRQLTLTLASGDTVVTGGRTEADNHHELLDPGEEMSYTLIPPPEDDDPYDPTQVTSYELVINCENVLEGTYYCG